jgi:hypothetical protein
MWIAFQFTVSVLAGGLAMWWDDHLWHQGTHNVGLVIFAAIFGFAVARGLTFLIVWWMYGWTAARSMRMLD